MKPRMQVYKSNSETDIIDLIDEHMDKLGWRTTHDKLTSAHDLLVRNNCSSSQVCFLLDLDGVISGYLMGTVVDHFILPQKVAVELGFYTRGTGGKYLLEAFEDWAKDQGANGVVLTDHSGLLDKYYTRYGYTLKERTYYKELEELQ